MDGPMSPTDAAFELFVADPQRLGQPYPLGGHVSRTRIVDTDPDIAGVAAHAGAEQAAIASAARAAAVAARRRRLLEGDGVPGLGAAAAAVVDAYTARGATPPPNPPHAPGFTVYFGYASENGYTRTEQGTFHPLHEYCEDMIDTDVVSPVTYTPKPEPTDAAAAAPEARLSPASSALAPAAAGGPAKLSAASPTSPTSGTMNLRAVSAATAAAAATTTTTNTAAAASAAARDERHGRLHATSGSERALQHILAGSTATEGAVPSPVTSRIPLVPGAHGHASATDPHPNSLVWVLGDGHGGISAVRYFVPAVKWALRALLSSRGWDFSHTADRHQFTRDATEIFHTLDRHFNEVRQADWNAWNALASQEGHRRPLNDGCTLNVVVIHGGYFVNLNLGDTRALLARIDLPALSALRRPAADTAATSNLGNSHDSSGGGQGDGLQPGHGAAGEATGPPRSDTSSPPARLVPPGVSEQQRIAALTRMSSNASIASLLTDPDAGDADHAAAAAAAGRAHRGDSAFLSAPGSGPPVGFSLAPDSASDTSDTSDGRAVHRRSGLHPPSDDGTAPGHADGANGVPAGPYRPLHRDMSNWSIASLNSDSGTAPAAPAPSTLAGVAPPSGGQPKPAPHVTTLTPATWLQARHGQSAVQAAAAASSARGAAAAAVPAAVFQGQRTLPLIVASDAIPTDPSSIQAIEAMEARFEDAQAHGSIGGYAHGHGARGAGVGDEDEDEDDAEDDGEAVGAMAQRLQAETAAAPSSNAALLWALDQPIHLGVPQLLYTSTDHNMRHPHRVSGILAAGAKFVAPSGRHLSAGDRYVNAAGVEEALEVDPARTRPMTWAGNWRIWRPASEVIAQRRVHNRYTLNLTATMGDLVFKVPPAILDVTPDIAFHRLERGAHYVVVMATDGIWDHLACHAESESQNQVVLDAVHAALVPQLELLEEQLAAADVHGAPRGGTLDPVTQALLQVTYWLTHRESALSPRFDSRGDYVSRVTGYGPLAAAHRDVLPVGPPTLRHSDLADGRPPPPLHQQLASLFGQGGMRYDDATALVGLIVADP
ncbi:hypothetical protein CXG81DRAFT_28726 [Caulochytrium protostelioides]|uniref:PPM-type phosphatase domain-containing protein n=1 Tax=Caulochytrium protostelioides TaxID=1555241 RepID=A0A4P9WY77_9FUNG|nr:hypothetical protein CXG81DRAFT_28726 [Caulochytrium protostelioides]|eukprot:RKO98441.1 hypothetical protein CXG81DRAFT_28726 [Caulochytrium protostelioides]